jgi:serine protease
MYQRCEVHVMVENGTADEESAAVALHILASAARQDSREAAARMSYEQARMEVTQKGDDLVAGALRALTSVTQATGSEADAAGVIYGVLAQHARDALAILSKTRTTRGLSSSQRVSVEALIKLTGRPALRVKKGDIHYGDPQIGTWREPLTLIQRDIPRLVASVGRIDLDGMHVGTGFVVAPSLVMTNRHVLEAIAVPLPGKVSPKSWALAQQGVTIDFLCEHGSARSLLFAVTGVAYAGPTPTNDKDYVDFSNLDLALLSIESTAGAAVAPPPPLPLLAGEIGSHTSQDVLVIGYPGRPAQLPVDAEGQTRQDVVDALVRIFGLRYGVKYLSPGAITRQPGSVGGDRRGWVFAHDATTLGGNSGSCVIRYGPKPAIVGLHFAGQLEQANYAHALQRVVGGKYLPPALASRFTWLEE